MSSGSTAEARKQRPGQNRKLLVAASAFTLLIVVIAWRTSTSPRNRLYYPPTDHVPIPTDQISIARGKHLAEAVAVCTICHGQNLGGQLAFQDSFLGRGYTSNLTRGRGGVGRTYTDADWVRNIRYGVRPDGHGIPLEKADLAQLAGQPGAIGSAHPRPHELIRRSGTVGGHRWATGEHRLRRGQLPDGHRGDVVRV